MPTICRYIPRTSRRSTGITFAYRAVLNKLSRRRLAACHSRCLPRNLPSALAVLLPTNIVARAATPLRNALRLYMYTDVMAEFRLLQHTATVALRASLTRLVYDRCHAHDAYVVC